MIRHNFCRSDGRLVKLFLFSTLLHKSSLTSIYFATFEKKREVRSPLPTQPNFLVFGDIIYLYIYNFCVEVFEKTISPTEIIDHSFERCYNGVCYRYVKMLCTGTAARGARLKYKNCDLIVMLSTNRYKNHSRVPSTLFLTSLEVSKRYSNHIRRY